MRQPQVGVDQEGAEPPDQLAGAGEPQHRELDGHLVGQGDGLEDLGRLERPVEQRRHDRFELGQSSLQARVTPGPHLVEEGLGDFVAEWIPLFGGKRRHLDLSAQLTPD